MENNSEKQVEKSEEQSQQMLPDTAAPRMRRRGRPAGSKNKPKFVLPAEDWANETQNADGPGVTGRKRSHAIHRRWQRDWIRPQFVLSRKEAFEIFMKYLRSASGKVALRDMILKGNVGIEKLSNPQLGKYLEHTNLLSRYPHDVVIKD